RHKVCPLRTGGLVREEYDFAVSPNDRMCYFYFPEHKQHLRDEVLEIVSAWPAVDQVFWREGEQFYGYRRATGDAIAWRRGGPLSDPNGARWTVEGALSTVDARLHGQMIMYGDYPNALSRVTQALSVPGGGTVVMTAALGHEFTSGFPMGRGNHGSLHAQDTYVPLLTCGLEQPLLNPRTTDLVPMILQAFGLPLPAYFGAIAGVIGA
ncbi:MAG TPA: hypothetical protein V6D47_03520, partial [Oscillatoriaceae cyanobacterium]